MMEDVIRNILANKFEIKNKNAKLFVRDDGIFFNDFIKMNNFYKNLERGGRFFSIGPFDDYQVFIIKYPAKEFSNEILFKLRDLFLCKKGLDFCNFKVSEMCLSLTNKCNFNKVETDSNDQQCLRGINVIMKKNTSKGEFRNGLLESIYVKYDNAISIEEAIDNVYKVTRISSFLSEDIVDFKYVILKDELNNEVLYVQNMENFFKKWYTCYGNMDNPGVICRFLALSTESEYVFKIYNDFLFSYKNIKGNMKILALTACLENIYDGIKSGEEEKSELRLEYEKLIDRLDSFDIRKDLKKYIRSGKIDYIYGKRDLVYKIKKVCEYVGVDIEELGENKAIRGLGKLRNDIAHGRGFKFADYETVRSLLWNYNKEVKTLDWLVRKAMLKRIEG